MSEAASKASESSHVESRERPQRGPAESTLTQGGAFSAIRTLQSQAGNRAVGHALGRGLPLPPDVRVEMEARFGESFDAVRVHADSHAREGADALNADAYTCGNHVFFDANRYSPNSVRGRELLAHELAHVVQQSHGGALQPRTDGTGPLEAEAHAASEAVSRGQSVQVSQGAAAGVSASPRSKWEALKALASDPEAALDKAREIKDAVVDAPGKLYDKAASGYDSASNALQQAAYNFDGEAAEELSDHMNFGPTLIAEGLDKLAESAADSETFAGPTQKLRNTAGPVFKAFRDANRDVVRETLVGQGFQHGVDSGLGKVDDAVQGLFRRYEQDDYTSEKPPEAAKPDSPMAAAGQNYLDDPMRALREGQVGVAQALWKLVPGTAKMINHPVATVRSLSEMPAIADPLGLLRATGETTGVAYDLLSGNKSLTEIDEEQKLKAQQSGFSKEVDRSVALARGLTHEWVKAYEEGRPIAATTHAATDIAMFVLPFLKGGQAGAATDALGTMSKADEVANATKATTAAEASSSTSAVRSANELAGARNGLNPLSHVPAEFWDDAIAAVDSFEDTAKVAFGEKKMGRIARGADVSLDTRMGVHNDEILPVGAEGLSREEGLARALDPFNHEFLDQATNSITKHLGIDPRKMFRTNRTPVSLASEGVKPGALFDRTFGEVSEMAKVFDEAVAELGDISKMKPTAVKAKLNKTFAAKIRNGSSPEALAVREALKSVGFEFPSGKGLTGMKPASAPTLSSAAEAADFNAGGGRVRIAEPEPPKVRVAAEPEPPKVRVAADSVPSTELTPDDLAAIQEAREIAEQEEALAQAAKKMQMRREH